MKHLLINNNNIIQRYVTKNITSNAEHFFNVILVKLAPIYTTVWKLRKLLAPINYSDNYPNNIIRVNTCVLSSHSTYIAYE